MIERILGSLALVLAVCVLRPGCDKGPVTPPSEGRLRLLCGSSMATPVQELGRQFGEARQVQLEYDLGGSETLLPKVLAGAAADVFVCHDPFEEKVKAAAHWTDTVAVGFLEPVLAVKPGNPKGLRKLEDLAGPGLKLGIGNPSFSTCGELFVEALRKRSLYDGVMKNVLLQARSHAEVANGLVVGPLDAVVVWNFVIPLYQGKLEAVPLDVKYPATRVTMLGLKNSPNPRLRDAFLEWCRQPLVLETFRRHGYGRATD